MSTESLQSESLTAELKKLNLSEGEVFARAKVIARFDQMIADPVGTFGRVKSTVNILGTTNAIDNLKEVRNALLTKKDLTPETTLTAWFNGWDAPGDTNLSVLSGTKTTYRRFITNVMSDSGIVSQIFPDKTANVRKTPAGEDIQRVGRFERLLVSLEQKYPNNEHKNIFRQTHAALQNGDLTKAKDICDVYIKKEWNIVVTDAIDTPDKLISTLRAIGDTQTAAQESMKTTASKLEKKDNLSASEKKLAQAISEGLNTEKISARAGAEKNYAAILQALPANDPERPRIQANKEKMIDELASQTAYMNIVDGYIKTNGATGLSSTLQMYDDMKGLYGMLNWSDENTKLAREGAIMLASFALTAGIGPLLGGIAMAARAGQVALTTSNVVRSASVVSRAKNMATAAYKVPVAATLGGVARTAEAGAALTRAAAANKFARIPAEALKFTGADEFIRSATRGTGDQQSGFYDFANKLFLNTVMFGAFAGMEKFVSAPVLAGLMNKLGVQNRAAKFVLGSTVLTGGDIAVMQTLHAAETGELEWDTHSIIQALAFRIGMKGVEHILPKLSAKYEIWKNGGGTKNPVISGAPTVSGAPNISGSNSVSGKPHISGAPIQKYGSIEEYMGAKTPEIQKRVTELSKQIGTIDSNVVVAVPFYAKEDIGGLLATLKGQKNNGEKIIIYVNAPKTGAGAVVEGEFQTKVNDLKRLTIDDPRFTIVEKHYDTRQTIGTIRADMADAISLSIQPGIKDPILVGLDADTYKLSKDYIQKVRQHFDANPDVSWGVAHLRWSMPGVDQATWLSERMMQAKMNRRGHMTSEDSTWSSGGSSSFRLSKYREAGGYDRSAKLGEDTALGASMDRANGVFSGSKIDQKVHVDPRRGTEALQKGQLFEEQWSDTFAPVDKSKFTPETIKEINTLTEQLRIGKNVSPTDLAKLEGFMNRHFDYGSGVYDGQAAEKFAKFWNTQATNSVFKIINKDGKIALIEKTSPLYKGDDIVKFDHDRVQKNPNISQPISSSPRISGGIPEKLSFRSEIDAMMKMDDATFNKNYDEALARIGDTGNRSYEAEMYESTAKVRKMSEQELVNSIIIPTKSRSKLVETNRQQLSAQHVNRGPSKLSLDDKALIIAENAAIRARLTNIIGDKIPGGIAGLAGDAAKGNNGAIAERLKGFDKRWLLLLLLLLPFLLKDCKGLSGTDAEKGSVSPTAAAAAICKECATGPESTIDKTRKNEYGKTLTEAYRNDISKRWMETKVWKDTIKSFQVNRAAMSQNSLQSNNVSIALDLVIKSPTVSNIAKLQHCIGMFDKKSVGVLKDTLDHKGAQDGILGPITTAAINRIISSCITPTTAPKVAPIPAVPTQSDDSNQSVKRDAMDNNTGIVTNEE